MSTQPFLNRQDVKIHERMSVISCTWVVKPGDVWQLGIHRLICGDCTIQENVEKLLGGENSDLLLTDPPYGISVVKGNGKIGGGGRFFLNGREGFVSSHEYPPIIGDNSTNTARCAINVFKTIPHKIIFGGNYFTDFLPPSRCWIVWNKKNSGNFAKAELAWTDYKQGVKYYEWRWSGMIREGPIVEELKRRVHPTQKPVGLFKLILQDFSEPGHTILDPFMGSGSSLIACERLGRKCLGMEISPDYCAVILQRYHDLTGIVPVKMD